MPPRSTGRGSGHPLSCAGSQKALFVGSGPRVLRARAHTHTHTHTHKEIHTDTHTDTPSSKSLPGRSQQLPAGISNLQTGRDPARNEPPTRCGPGVLRSPQPARRDTGLSLDNSTPASGYRTTAPSRILQGHRDVDEEAKSRSILTLLDTHWLWTQAPGGVGWAGTPSAGEQESAQSPKLVPGQATRLLGAVLSAISRGRPEATGQVAKDGPAEQEGIPVARRLRALGGSQVGNTQEGEAGRGTAPWLGRWGGQC